MCQMCAMVPVPFSEEWIYAFCPEVVYIYNIICMFFVYNYNIYYIYLSNINIPTPVRFCVFYQESVATSLPLWLRGDWLICSHGMCEATLYDRVVVHVCHQQLGGDCDVTTTCHERKHQWSPYVSDVSRKPDGLVYLQVGNYII